MDANELATRYSEATKKFSTIQREFGELVAELHHALDSLDMSKRDIPLFDPDKWPDAQHMQTAVKRWVNARNEAELAWNSIPEVLRAQMKSPPFLTRR